MAGTPSSDNIFLGAGEWFFNRIDQATGLHTGERHLGNCTSANLSIESEVKKKFSSMHAARTLYKQIITQIAASGKISMDEYDPENLALALFGETGVYTQAAGTNLSKSLTNVKQGRYYPMDRYKILNTAITGVAPQPAVTGPAAAYGTITSTGTVTASGTYTGLTDATYYVKITAINTVSGTITGCKYTWKKGLTGVDSAEVDATGLAILLEEGVSVALAVAAGQDFELNDTWAIPCTASVSSCILNVDYEVDAKTGRIYIVPGGHIVDDSDITVTYDCQVASIVKVMVGNTSKIEGYLRFVGDPTTGPAYHGDFWYVSIQPDGEAGFIAEDWGSLGIKFDCMSQPVEHPQEPFYRLLQF